MYRQLGKFHGLVVGEYKLLIPILSNLDFRLQGKNKYRILLHFYYFYSSNARTYFSDYIILLILVTNCKIFKGFYFLF